MTRDEPYEPTPNPLSKQPAQDGLFASNTKPNTYAEEGYGWLSQIARMLAPKADPLVPKGEKVLIREQPPKTA